jgi:competence protein ComGC
MTSAHGKTEGDRGFVLIDVLVALVIASVAFVIIIANISIATRHTAKVRERMHELISVRNLYTVQRNLIYFDE